MVCALVSLMLCQEGGDHLGMDHLGKFTLSQPQSSVFVDNVTFNFKSI